MSKLQKIGVQTYCYRHFKAFPDLIAQVKASNLDAIELWPGHVAHDSPEIDVVMAELSRNGIGVTGYGLVVFNDDTAANDVVFKYCQKYGIKAVTAAMSPDVKDIVARQANDYGIKIAMHNHGSNCPLGTIDKQKAFLEGADEAIGLCVDTAWAVQAGVNPVEIIDLFSERVYGLHIKDFILDGKGGWKDVPAGEGEIDLYAIMKAAPELPNLEYLTLEYEGDETDPAQAIRKSAVNILGAIPPGS